MSNFANPQADQSAWRRLILPFAISLITLSGLLIFVKVDVDYGAVLGEANLWYLVLAFLKIPLIIALWTYRWDIILRFNNIDVNWKKILTSTMIRSFFNNLTPGMGVGGEFAGAYYLASQTRLNFKQAIASAAAEKMIQGLAILPIIGVIIIIAIPTLPFTDEIKLNLMLALAFFITFMIFAVYISIVRFHYSKTIIIAFARVLGKMSKKVRHKFPPDRVSVQTDKFENYYKQFLKNKKTIFAIVFLTIIQAIMELGQHYFLFKALGFNLPFWVIAVNSSALKILSLFAILPGGSGFAEGLNFTLYSLLSNIPHPIVVAQTVLFRIFDAWIIWIIGGVFTSLASRSVVGTNISTR